MLKAVFDKKNSSAGKFIVIKNSCSRNGRKQITLPFENQLTVPDHKWISGISINYIHVHPY